MTLKTKQPKNNNGKAVLKSTRLRRVYLDGDFSDIQVEMLEEIVEKQSMCCNGHRAKVHEYEEIDNPGWHNIIRAIEDQRNDKN